jgi:hypothetical protein
MTDFGAFVAALNARALHRAGLLDDLEIGLMNVQLDFLERYAEIYKQEDQLRAVKSLREILPPDPLR